jgi:hypothetical protein
MARVSSIEAFEHEIEKAQEQVSGTDMMMDMNRTSEGAGKEVFSRKISGK